MPAALAIHPDFLRKLGLKDGQRLGLVRAPLEWIRTLREAHASQAQGGEVVAWASVAKAGKADMILAWLAPKDDLRKAFEALVTRIPPDGAIWAIIVKKSGLAKGELAIRWHAMQTAGLESGRLVDNKELRFDERYYGTRFVVRKDKR